MAVFFMNHIADIVICLILAVLFGLAIRFLVRRRGNACGCGGCSGCSGCGGGCAGRSGCGHSFSETELAEIKKNIKPISDDAI